MKLFRRNSSIEIHRQGGKIDFIVNPSKEGYSRVEPEPLTIRMKQAACVWDCNFGYPTLLEMWSPKWKRGQVRRNQLTLSWEKNTNLIFLQFQGIKRSDGFGNYVRYTAELVDSEEWVAIVVSDYEVFI